MIGTSSRAAARRIRLVVAGAVVGALAFGSGPATAFTDDAAPSTPTPVVAGSISGTVADGAGQPVADAHVSVIDADGVVSLDATTGSTGGYTVANVTPGEYYVSVAADGADPVFWPDATSLGDAQPVTVAGEQAVIGIDLTLGTVAAPGEEAGPSAAISGGGEETQPDADVSDGASVASITAEQFQISGKILDEQGNPVADVTVWAAGAGWGSTRSGSDGTFALRDLPAGSYTVQTSSWMYASQTIQTELRRDVELNITLQRGGRVSGKVLGAPTAQWITLLKAGDLSFGQSAMIDGATGAFTLEHIPSGEYLLLVDGMDGQMAPTLYPGVTNLVGATVLNVVSGEEIADLTFARQPGRSVSGTVNDAHAGSTHVELAPRTVRWNGREVVAYFASQSVRADDAGRYTVRNVFDTDYVARATNSSGQRFAEGFYDGAQTRADAKTLTVAGDVKDIDIRVFPHGTVSGDVITAGAAPLKNTLITAYRWNGATWDETLAVSGWGRYSLGVQLSGSSYGLPEGTYTVGFSDPDTEFGDDGIDYPYCPQYWDGKATLGAADRFTVTGSADTPGIDATLSLKSSGCASTDAIVPGAPVIEGTPRVGAAVTVTPGSWSPEPIELAYQWRANGVDIEGATAAIFTPTAAHVGTKLTVAVTGSRPGYENVTVVSPESTAVAAAVITPGTPQISGTPKAGSVLTADPGAWTPSDVTLTYQWTAGGENVPAATGPTFIPGDDQVGKNIAVTVTGTKLGHATASATSTPVGPVAATPLLDLQVGTPEIIGHAQVGVELTASPGTWGPQPVELTYSWSVGGTVVTGADTPRFTPGPDAVGKIVVVTVRGSKPGYAPGSAFAVAGPVLSGAISGGSATIAGDPRVGATLTAQSGGWKPGDVTLRYQWLNGDAPIEGATGQTLQPGADLLGAMVRVKVTATRAGYTDATVFADPVGQITPGTLQAGTASLSGPALSEVPLVVAPGTWGPAPVELSYQWLVDYQPIAGATGASYTPTTAQVGGHLLVAVTGAKRGYTSITTLVDAGIVSASIALDSSSALPGGAIGVTGTGFEPGETVRVELHSKVSQLGTAVADDEGSFRLTTVLPLDVIPGDHTVIGIGERSGREAQALITIGSPSSHGGVTPSTPASTGQTLPATGVAMPMTLAALGILFLVGGVVLLRRPVRRRS